MITNKFSFLKVIEKKKLYLTNFKHFRAGVQFCGKLLKNMNSCSPFIVEDNESLKNTTIELTEKNISAL
jgi:hypothetical protein